MAATYIPIVRTFCQVRAVLVSSIGLPRQAIRPGVDFAALVPHSKRRDVWRRLRAHGLSFPEPRLSAVVSNLLFGGIFLVVALLALLLQDWLAFLLVIDLGLIAYKMSRPYAVHMNLAPKTVGELVLYLTSLKNHKHCGYRWTRNEIALKVRFIIAEQLGLRMDDVQPETRFTDLGVD